MANITIVKLKVRRGSDAQRKTIVLDQGEIVEVGTHEKLLENKSSYFDLWSVQVGLLENDSMFL